MKRLTEFQQTLKAIDEWQPTENEQKWVDEYFGPPLTENQIYEMHLRHHLHLTEDEKGDGFHKTTKENKRNTSKDLLPKSLMPIFDESTDLKIKWKLFCKTLWWSKFVKHIDEIDESIWNIGESLLKQGVKVRKSPLIDYERSAKQREIILTNKES